MEKVGIDRHTVNPSYIIPWLCNWAGDAVTPGLLSPNNLHMRSVTISIWQMALFIKWPWHEHASVSDQIDFTHKQNSKTQYPNNITDTPVLHNCLNKNI